VRILAGKVITTFSPFNLAAIPIFTLSHRHYVKMVFSTSSSADSAVAAVKSLGFISYCPSCLFRGKSRLVLCEKCPNCGHILQFAGPMYLGPLWDSTLVEKMLKLNAKRKYRLKKENEKMLSAMLEESAIHSIGYYDLHTFAKKLKGAILPIDEALGKIRKKGFKAQRTHFCPTAIRTDASHGEVLKILRG
jgi:tRNA (guanine26-N2/guanine27-N2)-dimethyltransferase